jgi:hypothetical protein
MRHTQLLNYSLLSRVTDNEYIDINSDGNSYRTESTVFNSNANGNVNNNTYSDADSTAELKNVYKVSA